MSYDADSLFPLISTFRLFLGCVFLCFLCAIQHLQLWNRVFNGSDRSPKASSTASGGNGIKDGFHESVQEYGFCTSSECVRCRKNDALLVEARAKLLRRSVASYDGDLVRKVADAFHDALGRQQQRKMGRVFEYPGLDHRPFWKFDASRSLKEDVQMLEECKDEIFEEYRRVESLMSWEENRTSSGAWNTYYLVNQGKIKKENVNDCPVTFAVVQRLNHFLGLQNPFTNVAFSVLRPGTKIDAHYGPTNVRLRCHLPLLVPERDDCVLTVDGISRPWVKGKCLLFDDYFEHSAVNGLSASEIGEKEASGVNSNNFNKTRVVFLLDLWKPDVTLEEREMLSYALRE